MGRPGPQFASCNCQVSAMSMNHFHGCIPDENATMAEVFQKTHPTDVSNFVVNETAVQLMEHDCGQRCWEKDFISRQRRHHHRSSERF